MLDAGLDLVGRIDFAAPAVDLSPAGDAGLHLVAGEIAIDHLFPELVFGVGIDGVRARSDQRQVALQHVEELRQLVDRSLADEAADRRHSRVTARHHLLRLDVRLVGIHGAELHHRDHLVVEAVARLAEQDRPLGGRLDGDGRADHQRRQRDDGEAGDDDVEHALRHLRPAGDRAVEQVEEGHAPDVGV